MAIQYHFIQIMSTFFSVFDIQKQKLVYYTQISYLIFVYILQSLSFTPATLQFFYTIFTQNALLFLFFLSLLIYCHVNFTKFSLVSQQFINNIAYFYLL